MDEARHSGRKAVIAVSSHVVRGSVGNRAVVFAFESLGFSVWSVPTVVLPWHPGHSRAGRLIPDTDDFARLLKDLEEAPWLGEVGAVLSGYLGGADQAAPVASLVAAVKNKNPGALYLCDPVVGDLGGLYVAQSTAEAVRDQLVPIADIVTPNRYELAWLTDRQTHTMDAARAAAASLTAPRVLVTSAPCGAEETGNLLVERAGAQLARHASINHPAKGLGDLTAAVFLARLLDGRSASEALQSTSAVVYEMLLATLDRSADELVLASHAHVLSRSTGRVSLQQLDAPSALCR